MPITVRDLINKLKKEYLLDDKVLKFKIVVKKGKSVASTQNSDWPKEQKD